MEARVAIFMGSDSDLPIMKDAATALDELGIPYALHILSAHRTPDDVAEFARGARENGYRAIIAGAGGAAHLPGVIAAYTTLPVIGVPISSSTASLGGLDALLAIVQMPSGVPVGSMAINGARNAALFAAEIIGSADAAVADKLAQMRLSMAEAVRAKDRAAQSV